jgi:hypothetical protein
MGDTKSVSCSYLARSRTRCGQAVGGGGLMRGRATIQQDHVQSVGERREIENQCDSAPIQQNHIQSVGKRRESQS